MRLRPLLLGSASSAIFLAGFYELAETFAGTGAVIGFDREISTFIQAWRMQDLTAVMTGITAAGSVPAVVLAAFAVVVTLLLARRRGDAFFSAGLVGLGATLSAIAKGSFARARPPADDALIALPLSFSFPSGHTIGSFCLAYVAVYLAARARWPLVGKLLVAFTALSYTVAVGVSRVYLGVHWPSDVLAGWMLGAAIAAAATGAWEAVRTDTRKGLEMPGRA